MHWRDCHGLNQTGVAERANKYPCRSGRLESTNSSCRAEQNSKHEPAMQEVAEQRETNRKTNKQEIKPVVVKQGCCGDR